MELHFLGTGSAFPSPKRCSSCTALKHTNGDVWIFDCGEGSQIQIQNSRVKPSKITTIFITHLHGDHLFGLPGMMCTISQAIENQHVLVYGPVGIKNFLRSSLMLSFSNLSYSFTVHEIMIQSIEEFKEKNEIQLDKDYWLKLSNISNLSLPPHPNEVDNGRTINKNNEGVFDVHRCNRFSVFATEIKHSIPCLGYVICEDPIPGKLDISTLKLKNVPPGPLYGKIKSGETICLDDGTEITPEQCLGPERPGRKIVLLGDTHDPSEIAEIGKEASVLIHESTNENADKDKAISHGHSTAGMAGEFALKLNVKSLILTHFSQRYSDEETESILVKEAKISFKSDKVTAAKDFMVIPILKPK